MRWNNKSSINLSLACIYIFTLIMIVGDALAFKWVPWYVNARAMAESRILLFKLTVYIGSAFGYFCLYKFRKLLLNIRAGKVFTEENVGLMRVISWIFAAVAILCLASSIYYLPFILVAIACALMMLIIRIVKNAFEEAIDMKSELDLTI